MRWHGETRDCFIWMGGLGTCIFCKRSLVEVGRAVEHVIPGWLQREWNLSSKKISPIHLAFDGDVISSRDHNFAALLAGRVCQSCNGGWMSELEVSCHPLILPLAYGRRRVVELTDDEALLLARWAVKTAYALHSASNWRRVVDENHHQVLDKTEFKLPEGVFVLGHTYQCSRSVHWLQSTSWRLSNLGGQFTDMDHKALLTSGYRISLRIGGFFLSVLHKPLPDARLRLVLGRHTVLFPRCSHPSVRCPRQTGNEQAGIR
jgi:hypothetical protein